MMMGADVGFWKEPNDVRTTKIRTTKFGNTKSVWNPKFFGKFSITFGKIDFCFISGKIDLSLKNDSCNFFWGKSWVKS